MEKDPLWLPLLEILQTTAVHTTNVPSASIWAVPWVGVVSDYQERFDFFAS